MPDKDHRDKDDGIITLLAAWLLAHELADNWIRDAVARGSEPGADPLAALAVRVDERKEKLKEVLSQEVAGTGAPGELAELKEALLAVSRRLESLEARLDGLSARGVEGEAPRS